MASYVKRVLVLGIKSVLRDSTMLQSALGTLNTARIAVWRNERCLNEFVCFSRTPTMAASENFAGIDFDEIKEATALEVDEIKQQLKKMQESKREERKRLADDEAMRKIRQLEEQVCLLI